MLKKTPKISFKKQFCFAVLAIIIIFLSSELLVRFFLPQFNYNGISYEKSKNIKVFKGEKTFLAKSEISDKFFIRVDKNRKKINFEKNKNKIIVIGDSVTLGLGVKFEDTFVELIKKSIETENTTVIGFSNIGIDFNNVLDTLLENIIRISKEGDLIIYQFNYNDITKATNNSSVIKKKQNISSKIFREFQKIKFKYLNHSSFIKYLNHHFSLFFKNIDGDCYERNIESLGQYTYAFFSKGFENDSKISWSRFEKKLLKLKKLTDEKKLKLYVLISPISLQINNHEKTNKLNLDMNCSTVNGYIYLKSLLEKNNIEVIDPLMKFKKYNKKNTQLLFQPFDTNHPNKYGHKIIAEELYYKLSKYSK